MCPGTWWSLPHSPPHQKRAHGVGRCCAGRADNRARPTSGPRSVGPFLTYAVALRCGAGCTRHKGTATLSAMTKWWSGLTLAVWAAASCASSQDEGRACNSHADCAAYQRCDDGLCQTGERSSGTADGGASQGSSNSSGASSSSLSSSSSATSSSSASSAASAANSTSGGASGAASASGFGGSTGSSNTASSSSSGGPAACVINGMTVPPGNDPADPCRTCIPLQDAAAWTPVTACQAQDGCCPSGCNAQTDADCAAVCGNGTVESGELCDGNCPDMCADDGDPCTHDNLVGTGCQTRCTHPVKADGSGCGTLQTCQLGVCQSSCTAPDGTAVAHGETWTGHSVASVACGNTCPAPNTTITCQDGQWSGNAFDACTVSTPSGFGDACTSPANACAQTAGGTINCSGNCSASTPVNPAGYGNACTSSANACGQTATGTINCSGNCSAGTPANPSGYGNACTSSANACGQTASGTITCSGSCSASTPANPTGYGDACTLTSAANGCGVTTTCGGTINCAAQCGGTCSPPANACTFSWNVAYSNCSVPSGSTCAANPQLQYATNASCGMGLLSFCVYQTVTVTCRRSGDNAVVADGLCNAATRPTGEVNVAGTLLPAAPCDSVCN